MKFSTRSEYGLKAVIAMARIYPSSKSLKIIAQEERIPFGYLEHLAKALKGKKIIKSTSGKYGGYALAGKPGSFSVGMIIECLEGDLDPMNCSAGKCTHHQECQSAQIWKKLGREIKKTLYGIKLNNLLSNKI